MADERLSDTRLREIRREYDACVYRFGKDEAVRQLIVALERSERCQSETSDRLAALQADHQQATQQIAELTATLRELRSQQKDDYDRAEQAEARLKDLQGALELILAEPHGCPMCDSGKLRNPAKEHWDACGFARARALLSGPRVPAEETKLLAGIDLIAMERARQVAVEGWTPEHDDTHIHGELVFAAIKYADVKRARLYGWPWEESSWKPSADPIRNLAKAGALLAAEIDRLQRVNTDVPAEETQK